MHGQVRRDSARRRPQQPVPRPELQEALRAAGEQGRLAALGRAVPRPQRRGADDPGHRAGGPGGFQFKFSANMAILGIEVVDGGAERADSVEAALARVKPEADFVCVHDAARPCLADAWIDEIFAAAEKTGAAIFAVPVAGTLKRVGADGKIDETVSREGLWEAQTPQVFRRQLLLGRLRQARRLPGHRRRPTGRADRPSGDRRARLADQPEDHHQGRPAAGRAGAEGPAQAEAARRPMHPFADDDKWR